MKVTDFLARLERVKPAGANQWTALCPGHDDQHPSLSITEADGKILLKCFAGCDLVDILKPLRLEQKDLFFDGHQGKGMGGILTLVKPVNVSTPPQIVFRNS